MNSCGVELVSHDRTPEGRCRWNFAQLQRWDSSQVGELCSVTHVIKHINESRSFQSIEFVVDFSDAETIESPNQQR